jgi:chromosome segregation ATPase
MTLRTFSFSSAAAATTKELHVSEPIGRHCDQLRIKLHAIDRRLAALTSGEPNFRTSQHALESQLDRIEQRIYDNRVTVEAANARVKAWLEEKKAEFNGHRASWKKDREVDLLDARADDAEADAVAVFELAAAAADEAAQAALEALLARNDADTAAIPERDELT